MGGVELQVDVGACENISVWNAIDSVKLRLLTPSVAAPPRQMWWWFGSDC